jgi:hypothetical protein
MICKRCEQEIDGVLTRCATTCLCGGREGRIKKNDVLMAHVLDDNAYHETQDLCIDALKHRIMALEAHT